jgi:hypothetical protein
MLGSIGIKKKIYFFLFFLRGFSRFCGINRPQQLITLKGDFKFTRRQVPVPRMIIKTNFETCRPVETNVALKVDSNENEVGQKDGNSWVLH